MNIKNIVYGLANKVYIRDRDSLIVNYIDKAFKYFSNIYAKFTGTVDFTDANVIGLDLNVTAGVSAIQGDFIDNTDPQNPIIEGVENVLKQCKNDTGVPMPKGTPVKVTGVHGELPKIEIATASSNHVPSGSGVNEIFGIVYENISGHGAGPVLIYGSIKDINTNAYNVGDFLYVSPTGTLVNTPPAIPHERICIGLVIKKNETEGVICVRTSQPVHLNDIVGFDVNNLNVNDVIGYATNKFVNYKVAEIFPQRLTGTQVDVLTGVTEGYLVYVTDTSGLVANSKGW
jgi:hypothetical protein